MNIYELYGRQTEELEETRQRLDNQLREYFKLLNMLDILRRGQVDASRVSIDLDAQSWELAPLSEEKTTS